MQPITTEQATLNTASVEVKVLKLGRRQMTLSVFRQLPLWHIIDTESSVLRLHGEPWGIVNYFWDGCGYLGNNRHSHLHVVWVRKGKLFRACVGPLWAGERMDGGNAIFGDADGKAWLADGSWEVDCFELGISAKAGYAVGAWNALFHDLSQLDQLFIAV